MTGPTTLDSTVGADRLLPRIVGHLEDGGLLACPTDTVYGLGAAVDEEGVGRLSEFKARLPGKPFVVLLPELTGYPGAWDEEFRSWGLELSADALALSRALWPGPLTLVVSDPAGRFPEGVRGPAGGVAVRICSHPFVRALLGRWKRPLLSTSANPPGESPAVTAIGLAERLSARPHADRLWIVDAGPLEPSRPSTLIDCAGNGCRVLREGAVPLERIRELVPRIETE